MRHDNIKIDLKETKCQHVDRIHLNQSIVKRRTLVKNAVKIWVAQTRLVHAYRLIECFTKSDYYKHAPVVVII